MSERGIVLSEIVAQLVAEARRQEGLSMDQLAERAGVDRAHIDLLERRSRQPTLAVAANLAEALGLSLSALVAEAEHGVGVGDGSPPELELLPAPARRQTDRAHLRESSQLTATTALTGGMVTRAIDLAYRKLDLVDEQIRGSGSHSIVALVEDPDLSSLVANLLSAGIARASNGLYVQSGPDHSSSLLPLRQGLPELDVAAALETNRPAPVEPRAGLYVIGRYVLAERDGTFTRGKESRGDTAAVWEVRFGELREYDFHARSTRAAGGGRQLKKEALDRMELVYYDPELLPYARPTGAYARAR
ncbi:MAG: helix-turn-helix domain-containing protein [Gaiellaceae bacterium]